MVSTQLMKSNCSVNKYYKKLNIKIFQITKNKRSLREEIGILFFSQVFILIHFPILYEFLQKMNKLK